MGWLGFAEASVSAGAGAGAVERVWLRPGTRRHLRVPEACRREAICRPGAGRGLERREPWLHLLGARFDGIRRAGVTPSLDPAGGLRVRVALVPPAV